MKQVRKGKRSMEDIDVPAKRKRKEKNVKSTTKKQKIRRNTNFEIAEIEQDAEMNENEVGNEYVDEVESDSSVDDSIEKHKEALKNLATIDPEFHEFLQENDRGLLNFESSASENEDETTEQFHEPPDSLEVASDASDYEDDLAGGASGKVTMQMVDAWEKELNSNKRSLKPVRIVVRAFHACLVRVSADSADNSDSGFRVDGSAVFNAVVRLCVSSLYPYLKKVMSLPSSSVTKKHVESSKKWPYVKSVIRSYLVDLFKLLNNVTSEDILRVLLKHLHQLIPFAACLPTISKPLLKQVITLWSTNNDDTVKVISFLCLLRYAACDINTYLHSVLKKMYVAYVANCKFVSQNSLPAINFLRKSLAEMFTLNETIAYNHAFLYIRQLAIYLRGAVTLKKKDSIQTVYNWQFISSLRLWVDVLCSMREKQQMSSLIYPTIQIIIGCMKLIPTAQYFPLRFHCIEMLIKLSREIEVFIPVLPFLIEALTILHVSTKQKKLSMKPLDFTYILRLSKSQLQENAFKDAVVDNVYDCLLQYTASESFRISFPDTVVFLLIQVKQFLKDCKNANYSRKLKPLVDKIEDVSKMMSQERSKCGIALSNVSAIAAWESNMKLKSNSLITFYESWRKMQEQKTARRLVDEIQFSEHDLPVLTKLPGKKKEFKEVTKKKGDRVVLFDSDAEDDSEFDFDFEKNATERKKKKKKTNDESSIEKSKGKSDDDANVDEKPKKKKKKKKKRNNSDEHIEDTRLKKKSKKLKPANSDDAEEKNDVIEDLEMQDFLS